MPLARVDDAISIYFFDYCELHCVRLNFLRRAEHDFQFLRINRGSEANWRGQVIPHSQVFKSISNRGICAQWRITVVVIVNIARVWVTFDDLQASQKTKVIYDPGKLA